MDMDICKNCNSHGMSKLSQDTSKLDRRCSLCGWIEKITEEMKMESKGRIRP